MRTRSGLRSGPREGFAAAKPSAYCVYQAWSAPQCGHITLVETLAQNR